MGCFGCAGKSSKRSENSSSNHNSKNNKLEDQSEKGIFANISFSSVAQVFETLRENPFYMITVKHFGIF